MTADLTAHACQTGPWGGQLIDSPCEECEHALIMHVRRIKVCSICDAVRQILGTQGPNP